MEGNSDYERRKAEQRERCQEYLGNTPQLKQLLNDFTVALLGQKPDDVRAFAKIYFSMFIPEEPEEKAPVAASRGGETKKASATDQLAKAMETKQGKAELKALFDGLDKNADGKVSSKEWGQGVFKNKDILSRYFGGSSLKEIGLAFKHIDSDGNAELTWEEFEVAVGSFSAAQKTAIAMGTPEGQAELKTLFEALDKDADGKVTSKEFGKGLHANQQLVAKFFGGHTMAELGKAFRRIDEDKSGDLSWSEFVDAAQSLTASNQLVSALGSSEGRLELQQLFNTLDKDSDGCVTSKEWGRGLMANKELMGKYFGGSSPAAIGKAFRRIDKNSDKGLSWFEFEEAAFIAGGSAWSVE